MSIIEVETSLKKYPIFIEEGIIESFIETCKKKRVFIATDSNIAALYPFLLKDLETVGATIHIIPAGEHSKNAQELSKIYSNLLEKNFDRSSTIVALGGGVIGDMVGYAAATFMRGVTFIQIPTTLLSMVDSSIGGKVAINHPLGKNMIGVFKPPDAVYIDPNFLKTLSMQERHCGMAEIVKHAIIKDVDYFSFLEQNYDEILNLKDMNLVKKTIARSCEIKKEIVEADEFEVGIRATLNYGHTLGHALETITNYEYFKHGEAITYGMMFAGQLSKIHAGLSSSELLRQNNLLKKIHIPNLPKTLSLEKLGQLMIKDKKNINSREKKEEQPSIKFVLIKKIGLVQTKTTSIKYKEPSNGVYENLKLFLTSNGVQNLA